MAIFNRNINKFNECIDQVVTDSKREYVSKNSFCLGVLVAESAGNMPKSAIEMYLQLKKSLDAD